MYIKKTSSISDGKLSKIIEEYNHSSIKRLLIFIFSLTLVTLLIANYETIIAKDISRGVIRFHVRANSDSTIDQQLKLKVRDGVLKHLESAGISPTSMGESVEYLSANLHIINQVAQSIIYENGFDYNVTTSLEEEEFPEKSYGNVTLPEGRYRSLIIRIGNADGHNWWCVLYPPLCFVDVSTATMPSESQSKLKDSVTSNEFEHITSSNKGTTTDSNSSEYINDSPDIQYRFKFLTFLNYLFE